MTAPIFLGTHRAHALRTAATVSEAPAWRLYEPLALRPFSRKLARAADRFAGLSRPALRWFLVSAAPPQFAVEAFALKLPFEELQGLVDIVVADEYLDDVLLTVLRRQLGDGGESQISSSLVAADSPERLSVSISSLSF